MLRGVPIDLHALIRLPARPRAWAEGDNIPWNEPAFSRRMLAQHLSQDHDAASRRAVTIDAHVDWIHRTLLGGAPGCILDLGCGPGLYANRLASLGHECVGIDWSPASIEYARAQAPDGPGRARYLQADLRDAEYRPADVDAGFDLVMLLFGELNVFEPVAARELLSRCRQALRPGGTLLVEPHTFGAVEALGRAPATWSRLERGLFSDRPHLYLVESSWNDESATATRRYAIVDAATSEVEVHAQSFQAYRDEDYGALFAEHGFVDVKRSDGVGAPTVTPHEGLCAFVARPA